MSDAPLSACPECGGSVSKLMSMNSFHLKGSGWYVTDYARKNGPGGSTAKTDKSSAAAPAAEKKTETKTESACTGGETV
jgi:predicted nucleic acid-binding Zn ribbon protein